MQGFESLTTRKFIRLDVVNMKRIEGESIMGKEQEKIKENLIEEYSKYLPESLKEDLERNTELSLNEKYALIKHLTFASRWAETTGFDEEGDFKERLGITDEEVRELAKTYFKPITSAEMERELKGKGVIGRKRGCKNEG